MRRIVAIVACGIVMDGVSVVHADAGARQRDALGIVARYGAQWDAVPSRTPAEHSVDGPLMGNGDMGVVLGGPPERQQFHLCKNDLWRLQHTFGKSSPVGFGYLEIRIPELSGASYDVSQVWACPETVSVFETPPTREPPGRLRMRSMVSATRNLLLLHLEAEGCEFTAEAVLNVLAGRGSVSDVARQDGVILGTRRFPMDVDIPSGAAVAWNVIDTPAQMIDLPAEPPQTAAVPPRTQTYPVQLGREQWGEGRWGFRGAIDDLTVYGRALAADDVGRLAMGVAPAGAMHTWTMDQKPKGAPSIQSVPGKRQQAWQFTGETSCFLDCGEMSMPIDPVTVAAWIRIEDADTSGGANYMLSCGAWNTGLSFGLSEGKLRFSVNGAFVETATLPKGEWVHVAATWNGSAFRAFVNGRPSQQSGSQMPSDGMRFVIQPGHPVTLALAMDSLFKSKTYVDDVVTVVAGFTRSDADAVRRAHAAWWADYWAKSYVDLDDPAIAGGYYRSLYALGAASRDPDFPPGLFGWNTMDNPMWFGDYHVNYNHMAPFYGLYSANRLAQADPGDAPLLAFRERGRWYAQHVTETRGVLYPVGLGPLGIETTRHENNPDPNVEKGGHFHMQRSNAAYCLVNMAQRWRTTYDPAYGARVYPFVREVVDFWEDYLVWEPGVDQTGNGRYVILGDAIHEGSGFNKNPILTLGLLYNAFDLALDMSHTLGLDAGRREKWHHIQSHLSGWTTQEKDGETVFRYSEEGPDWWGSNTLGIQHIFPGNALGLASDPKWLSIARNTLRVMNRWVDFNGSNSFFPAAVRVGMDPQLILDKLRAYVDGKYPNGFIRGNPHGIENFSTTPNTINEMLCMSAVPLWPAEAHAGPESSRRLESLIRVFPVWPTERNARFVDIRTWGAFLVSSELKDGEVQYVNLVSEQGRPCTLVNPWPGKSATLQSDRGTGKIVSGQAIAFPTLAGERFVLRLDH